MALTFNPPEWLLQEYMNRKRPVDNLAETVSGISKDIVSQRQNQMLLRLKQQEADQQAKELAMKGNEYAFNTGDTSFLSPNVQAGIANPRPVGPVTESGQLPSESPIITHSREFFKKYPQGYKGAEIQNKTDANANSLDEITAEKVRKGEISLQDAYKMKAMGTPAANGVQWIVDPMTGLPNPYPKQIPGGVPAPSQGNRPSATSTSPTDPFAGLDYKTRVKRLAEKPKAYTALNDAMRQYDNMIADAEAIKNDPSLNMATGLAKPLANIPGTGPKRVSSRLDTLKSKTTIGAMAALKNLSSNGSTGFGQLSEKEGEVLRNAVTNLDLGMNSKDFTAALDRFITEMKAKKDEFRNTFDSTYGPMDGNQTGKPNPRVGVSDPLGIR